jgi:hypothetical protein
METVISNSRMQKCSMGMKILVMASGFRDGGDSSKESSPHTCKMISPFPLESRHWWQLKIFIMSGIEVAELALNVVNIQVEEWNRCRAWRSWRSGIRMGQIGREYAREL